VTFDAQEAVRQGTQAQGAYAVAGQVAGHDVQQPCQRGRPGEGQDRDGGEVVGGAERAAQVLVGEVGQRAPGGIAPRLELW
jgi:hypothetical protein